MKVIVAIDQKNLGKRGDIIQVKDGYARNFLIPKGMVLPYSAGNLKKLDMEKASYEKKVRKEMIEIEKIAEAINGTVLTFVEKIHDENKLYGSISEKDIHDKLIVEGFSVEKDQIVITDHFKVTGEHDVMIKLKGGSEASIKVIIKAEAEQEAKPATPPEAKESAKAEDSAPAATADAAEESPVDPSPQEEE